jgi:hypothetical protein
VTSRSGTRTPRSCAWSPSSKQTVDGGDVDKFRRDLLETNAHGVLVSARCHIVQRRRGAVFERLSNGKYAAYVCAQRGDEHADEEIDTDAIVSAIRVLHLLDEVTAAQPGDNDLDGGATLSRADLDRVEDELGRWTGTLRELRENQKTLFEQADVLRRTANRGIAITNDLEVSRIRSIITGDVGDSAATGAGPVCAADAPVTRELACLGCGKTYKRQGALDTHISKCKGPKAASASLEVASASSGSRADSRSESVVVVPECVQVVSVDAAAPVST